MEKLPSFMWDNYNTDKCELLIDYYMSWTFRCAQEYYKPLDTNVNYLSKKILSKCLFNDYDYLETKKVLDVKSGKNCKNIDLWVEVEIENEQKKYVMIIESKMYTQIRSGQLKKYKDFIDNYYRGKKDEYVIKYIFLRVENISEEDKNESKESGYLSLSLDNIQTVLKESGETGNILFDEFWFRWWITNKNTDPFSSDINKIFGL